MAKLTDDLSLDERAHAANTLERAIQNVSDPANWINDGSIGDADGPACALGHVTLGDDDFGRKVGYDGIQIRYPGDDHPAVKALFDALPPGTPKNYEDPECTITVYNDDSRRSHKAIVKLFQRALALVKP